MFIFCFSQLYDADRVLLSGSAMGQMGSSVSLGWESWEKPMRILRLGDAGPSEASIPRYDIIFCLFF